MVSEIYIDRRFLKDGCYSQQVTFAAAKESLIPKKTSDTVTPNATLNQIKKCNIRLSLFERQLLLHANIHKKIHVNYLMNTKVKK